MNEFWQGFSIGAGLMMFLAGVFSLGLVLIAIRLSRKKKEGK